MIPNRKITASGLGGAVAIILTWALGLLGLEVPGEVGAAFATVVTVATGYITKEHNP